MLKEIRCDKFLSNGQPRKPIIFKNGLNTVVGDSNKSNSIGKSTFLMIVDFCFGGEDYINKEKDTILHVGAHSILFTFEFNGIEHYYSRSTSEPNFVFEYFDKERTSEKKKLSIYAFREELLNYYGLQKTGLTFRAAVGRFFRIYNRNTHNELRPLNSVAREDDRSGIEFLLKLYNEYGNLSNLNTELETAQSKKNVYDNLRRYNVGYIALTKEEYEKNQQLIEKLSSELKSLKEDNEKGMSDEELIIARERNELSKERTRLKRLKSIEENRLEDISFDKEFDTEKFAKEFNKLKEFCPEIDINRIEQYEQFHKKVKRYLAEEIKTNNKNINDNILLLSEQIKIIDDKLAHFKSTPNVSDAVLNRHAELVNKIAELKKANENYEARQQANSEFQKLQKGFEDTTSSKTNYVENIVNNEMKRISDLFENGRLYAPELKINGLRSYSFYTPNDNGTGSRYKALAIFDLAIMNTTSLPVIVHDSIVFSNIENSTVEKLLKLYSEQTQKQIIIAFDKLDKKDIEIEKILSANKILELSDEPNALFGKQWNKKEN